MLLLYVIGNGVMVKAYSNMTLTFSPLSVYKAAPCENLR